MGAIASRRVRRPRRNDGDQWGLEDPLQRPKLSGVAWFLRCNGCIGANTPTAIRPSPTSPRTATCLRAVRQLNHGNHPLCFYHARFLCRLWPCATRQVGSGCCILNAPRFLRSANSGSPQLVLQSPDGAVHKPPSDSFNDLALVRALCRPRHAITRPS
jgi:hypothetical protein